MVSVHRDSSSLNFILVSQVSNRTVRLDKRTEEEILAQMIFFRTSASLKTLVVAPSGQIVVRLWQTVVEIDIECLVGMELND